MELKDIIEKMDLLREELDSLRPIPEDRMNRLNQKLRLDWNYHSNSIEGNTLTASETKAFILYGITANGKPFRDYIEMRGHNEALKKLENIVHHDLKITENLIKEFHKIILVEPYSGEAEINPGEYKTLPNYLYSPTGERIDFEPPQEVPRLMNELINWLNNHIDPPKRKKKKYDLHPLLIASGFHARFIQIHPFGDGNGRMSRILMNLILMLCGYVPAVIKLEKRKEYYTALNLSSLENMTPLAEFVGEECIQSLEMAVKAAKGESIDEPDDLDKELTLLNQELKNLEAPEIIASKEASSIKNVLNDFVKIVQTCREKAAKFQEYYKSYGENYQIMTKNPSKGLIYHNIEAFKKNIDTISLTDPHQIIIKIDLNYFIKSINEEKNDNAHLRLTFNSISFKIGIDGQFSERKYHQLFNENEIKGFANQFANNRLQKVKQFIEELKNKQN